MRRESGKCENRRERLNLALLIPDGVGVRNFLIGPFLQLARQNGDCQVLHLIPEQIIAQYSQGTNGQIHWQAFADYRESRLSLLLRQALSYAHLYWCDTVAMRHNLTRPLPNNWRVQAVHRVARFAGRAAASESGIQRLDRWHCSAVGRLPEVEHYRQLFQRLKPSVLFCSHQRPRVILPAVLAARSLGIPTATFIFSWDNLTSKGRIAAPFDHFLVWSALMRDELMRFYPDVSAARVHIVGTPQFDPYADKQLLWTRAEFLARIGADPARPLLCYSGGDSATAIEDPEFVSILLQKIRDKQIKHNPQVLLRPAPVDDGQRYEAVRRAYPELLYAQPAWLHVQPDDWARVVPLPEDVQFLANLAKHADININMASTMTLDFAIHDRPVINVAFDVAQPPVNGKPLWDFYYQFDHYRAVVESGAAKIAHSPDELATHINAYLDDPALDREARRRLVELEVSLPIGQSCQRIIEVLKRIERAN